MSSNYIALFSSIAALLSLYIYLQNKEKRYIAYSIFCIIGVVLTGSRKGILLLAFFTICFINIVIKGRTALKIIAFILLAVIGLLAVTQIPVLYSIIGERLIELILHTFGQSTSEGSIVARDRYRGYAFNWIASNPIFGQGVGTFKNIYKNIGINLNVSI